MFGLSLAEISIIIVAGIIFIKPDDIPVISRQVSAVIKKLKALVNSSSKEISKLKADFQKEYGDEFFDNIEEINAEVSEIIGDDGKKYKAYNVAEVEKEIAESKSKDD